GGFAGAVGLLHAQAVRGEQPINFARPKEPKPQTDPHRRKVVLGAALAAAALVAAVVFAYLQLDEVDTAVAQQNAVNAEYDAQLRRLDEDRRRIDALGEWEDGGVNWLEEMHDLTDRFPDTGDARLVSVTFDQLARPAKKQPKQRVFAGKITLAGISRERKPVDVMMSKFDQDGHYRLEPLTMARNQKVDRRNFPQEFSTKVEVEKIPSNQYQRRLEPPAEPDRRRAARDAGREE
ncbi:MAG TPA: hypothetical protein VFA26_14415, partial [Gemmataceae bacterium]|nr:hypothetical protein [Gemmataceae bacterium]